LRWARSRCSVQEAANARKTWPDELDKTQAGEIATLFDLVPAMRPHLQIVRVAPVRVVDAVTAEGLRALTLPQRYPRGVGIERTQSIGSRAYEANALGIACRTADATRRTTIVIEGEELAVFDIALDRVSAQKPLSFADWYPLETGRAEPLSDEDRLNP